MEPISIYDDDANARILNVCRRARWPAETSRRAEPAQPSQNIHIRPTNNPRKIRLLAP